MYCMLEMNVEGERLQVPLTCQRCLVVGRNYRITHRRTRQQGAGRIWSRRQAGSVFNCVVIFSGVAY
jgi:hypothetical protein